MDNHTIVTLKKGEGRTIKAGGLWIYENEIDTIVGTFQNGAVVTVHDFDGYPMGRGFINRNSKIRIRMMTRNQDQEIDEAFPDNESVEQFFTATKPFNVVEIRFKADDMYYQDNVYKVSLQKEGVCIKSDIIGPKSISELGWYYIHCNEEPGNYSIKIEKNNK